jgi:hypothetical protein
VTDVTQLLLLCEYCLLLAVSHLVVDGYGALCLDEVQNPASKTFTHELSAISLLLAVAVPRCSATTESERGTEHSHCRCYWVRVLLVCCFSCC